MIIVWAPCTAVIRGGGGSFLWEYMDPLIPLDLFVAPEWEEHKFSSYLTGAEGSHKSSYESLWRMHINWCF